MEQDQFPQKYQQFEVGEHYELQNMMNFQLKIAQKKVLVKKDFVLGFFDKKVFFKHF